MFNKASINHSIDRSTDRRITDSNDLNQDQQQPQDQSQQVRLKGTMASSPNGSASSAAATTPKTPFGRKHGAQDEKNNDEASAGGFDTTHLNFGTPTPGTPATTGTKFFTPLSIFSQDAGLFKDDDNDNDSQSNNKKGNKSTYVGLKGDDTEEDGKSLVSARGERLGITSARYYSSDDGSDTTSASVRIGITRTSYDLPDGDFPLTPTSVFLDKKNGTPTPQLVSIDNTDAGSEFGGNWRTLLPAASKDQSDHSQSIVTMNDNVPDGIPRLIHKQTAEGHYLVSSKPVASPMDGTRYSLADGKLVKTVTTRNASEGRLAVHDPSTPRPGVSKSASVPAGLLTPASQQPIDASFKIFILLLAPRSKIFELVQIVYSPSITTVGGVLGLIPNHATEPALGSQEYIGLARPKDGSEITDLDKMASGRHDERECALITQGEILVGIPLGYSGELVANISKPIFANTRIRKLLRRSDPLSAKKHRRSGAKKSRRSRRSNAPRVATVAEGDEADSSLAASNRSAKPSKPHLSSNDVALAIRFANEQAKKANEDVPIERKTSESDIQSLVPSVTSFDSKPSLDRLDHDESMSVGSTVSGNETGESSLNNSYHFRNTLKRMPRRSTRKRTPRDNNKKRAYIIKMAAAAFGLMVCQYMTKMFEEDDDEEYYDDTDGEPSCKSPSDVALGILGLFQCLIFFLAMVDLQRRANRRKHRSASTTNGSNGNRTNTRHVKDLDDRFRRAKASTT